MARLRLANLGFAALLAGCSTTSANRTVAWKKSHHDTSAPQVADPAYQVGVGDQLVIRTAKSKSDEVAEVLGDGALHLPKRPPIRVDGCTTAEIVRRLGDNDGLEGAQVSVKKYNSQFLHVYGLDETDRAKSVPYRGAETLSDLVGRIGCKTHRRGTVVKLVRPAQSLGADPEIFSLHLDEDFASRDESRNVIIQSNDYIYIEKDRGQPTTIAEAKERRAANPFWRLFPAKEPRKLARRGDD